VKKFVSLLLFVSLCTALAGDTADNQLRLCLKSDPKTFDPLKVEEESGEVIRYLTSGVLIRLNRTTQKPEPELATSWKITQWSSFLRRYAIFGP
jgi:ABC-type transport system substrate-binding protein